MQRFFWLQAHASDVLWHANRERDNAPSSDRKLRLLTCALFRNSRVLPRAGVVSFAAGDIVSAAEEFADAKVSAQDCSKARDLAASLVGRTIDRAAVCLREDPFSAARSMLSLVVSDLSAYDSLACVRLADVARDVLGPYPGPADWVSCCAWHTPDVKALATAAYEDQGRPCLACNRWTKCEWCDDKRRINDGSLNADRLAVLADALEEAGCDDEDALRHLRGFERCHCLDGAYCDKRWSCGGTGWVKKTGPHVRGCWALDLALGRK